MHKEERHGRTCAYDSSFFEACRLVNSSNYKLTVWNKYCRINQTEMYRYL